MKCELMKSGMIPDKRITLASLPRERNRARINSYQRALADLEAIDQRSVRETGAKRDRELVVFVIAVSFSAWRKISDSNMDYLATLRSRFRSFVVPARSVALGKYVMRNSRIIEFPLVCPIRREREREREGGGRKTNPRPLQSRIWSS